MIKEPEKKRKYGNERKFIYIDLHNRWFRNGFHSLLSWADARGNAEIIYRM